MDDMVSSTKKNFLACVRGQGVEFEFQGWKGNQNPSTADDPSGAPKPSGLDLGGLGFSFGAWPCCEQKEKQRQLQQQKVGSHGVLNTWFALSLPTSNSLATREHPHPEFRALNRIREPNMP